MNATIDIEKRTITRDGRSALFTEVTVSFKLRVEYLQDARLIKLTRDDVARNEVLIMAREMMKSEILDTPPRAFINAMETVINGELK